MSTLIPLVAHDDLGAAPGGGRSHQKGHQLTLPLRQPLRHRPSQKGIQRDFNADTNASSLIAHAASNVSEHTVVDPDETQDESISTPEDQDEVVDTEPQSETPHDEPPDSPASSTTPPSMHQFLPSGTLVVVQGVVHHHRRPVPLRSLSPPRTSKSRHCSLPLLHSSDHVHPLSSPSCPVPPAFLARTPHPCAEHVERLSSSQPTPVSAPCTTTPLQCQPQQNSIISWLDRNRVHVPVQRLPPLRKKHISFSQHCRLSWVMTDDFGLALVTPIPEESEEDFPAYLVPLSDDTEDDFLAYLVLLPEIEGDGFPAYLVPLPEDTEGDVYVRDGNDLDNDDNYADADDNTVGAGNSEDELETEEDEETEGCSADSQKEWATDSTQDENSVYKPESESICVYVTTSFFDEDSDDEGEDEDEDAVHRRMEIAAGLKSTGVMEEELRRIAVVDLPEEEYTMEDLWGLMENSVEHEEEETTDEEPHTLDEMSTRTEAKCGHHESGTRGPMCHLSKEVLRDEEVERIDKRFENGGHGNLYVDGVKYKSYWAYLYSLTTVDHAEEVRRREEWYRCYEEYGHEDAEDDGDERSMAPGPQEESLEDTMVRKKADIS
ncbi:hypothetical protein D9615_009388 [Tricholomella constricta]|uniref:Uncharacterized protein n=1 Tax=Tricholomella constricta TaxID=117010 RepID=A0A8H5H3E7_9AGAR|nr:hypothetical protein D9615_009388 [Tricholomella constricta]